MNTMMVRIRNDNGVASARRMLQKVAFFSTGVGFAGLVFIGSALVTVLAFVVPMIGLLFIAYAAGWNNDALARRELETVAAEQKRLLACFERGRREYNELLKLAEQDPWLVTERITAQNLARIMNPEADATVVDTEILHLVRNLRPDPLTKEITQERATELKRSLCRTLGTIGQLATSAQNMQTEAQNCLAALA
jgi:hypothetical protein